MEHLLGAEKEKYLIHNYTSALQLHFTVIERKKRISPGLTLLFWSTPVAPRIASMQNWVKETPGLAM